MHRLAAALLLLCFAWTQASAAVCPVLPDAAAGGAAHHAAASAHEGHGAHAPAAPREGHRDERPPHHTEGVCPMAASCGLVAAPAGEAGAALPHPSRTAAFFAPGDPHATPYLGSDPPPPRHG